MRKIYSHNGALSLCSLSFFVLATIVMLFPLPIQLADHVPDWGDPLENAWVLAWDARQLTIDPLALYHANIFYPYANTLAFSESQIASAVVGLPLYLASDNPILAYNFVFMLSFVLSGFNAYLLAYDLTRSRWGALLAGFVFAFGNYKLNHLSHINLVTLQWLPLALFSLRRAVNSRGWALPLLFAISFSAQVLSSWYAAWMTALGLALLAGYYMLARRDQIAPRGLFRLGVTMLPAVVLIGAAALPYFQVSRDLDFARTVRDAEMYSATPLSFISVPRDNRLYGGILPRATVEALFPGAAALVLGVIGALTRRRVADRAFWLVLIFVFAILAFGPSLRFSASAPPLALPYRVLYDFLPGFKGTRAPARFFSVGLLGLALLAAGGMAWLAARARGKSAWVGVAALCLVGLEYNVLPVRLASIETGARVPAVYRWLAGQGEGNVVELSRVGQGVEGLTRAMYFSTYHWRSTPLGYASFVPLTMFDFSDALTAALDAPSPRLVNLLREFRVRYLLIQAAGFSEAERAELQTTLRGLDALQPAYTDANAVVYQVTGAAPPHPLTLSYLLPAVARAERPYIAYVVVQHPRRYPIVNADRTPHALTLVWKKDGAQVATQNLQVQIPPVLRDRPEGLAVTLSPPQAEGTFQVEWFWENKPLAAVDQNATVTLLPREDGAGKLELVSYAFGAPESAAGQELGLTLYWRRRAAVNQEHQVVVKIVDEAGRLWALRAEHSVLSFTYPTYMWRENELVALEYVLALPREARAGLYRAVIELTRGASTIAFVSPRGEDVTEFVSAPFRVVAP